MTIAQRHIYNIIEGIGRKYLWGRHIRITYRNATAVIYAVDDCLEFDTNLLYSSFNVILTIDNDEFSLNRFPPIFNSSDDISFSFQYKDGRVHFLFISLDRPINTVCWCVGLGRVIIEQGELFDLLAANPDLILPA